MRGYAGKLIVAALCATLVPVAVACSDGGGDKTATAPPQTRTAAASPSATTATPAVTALASATIEGGGAPTQTTSAAAGPLCAPGDVKADVHEQGGAGSIGGSLEIQDTSAAACVLRPPDGQAVPQLRIEDASGAVLPTQQQAQPAAVPNASVLLQPGESAFVTYVWSNWCGDPLNGTLSVTYALPDGSEISATIAGSTGQDAVPRCDDSSQPSTLLVGSLIKRAT